MPDQGPYSDDGYTVPLLGQGLATEQPHTHCPLGPGVIISKTYSQFPLSLVMTLETGQTGTVMPIHR